MGRFTKGQILTVEQLRIDILVRTSDGRLWRVYRQFDKKTFQIAYYPEMNDGEGTFFMQGTGGSRGYDSFVYERDFEEKMRPLPEPTLDTESGWLSPDGKLYPCVYTEHNALEARLMAHFDLKPKMVERFTCGIEAYGWIKLQDGTFYGRMDRRSATNAQKSAVLDWCHHNKRGYPKFLTQEDEDILCTF